MGTEERDADIMIDGISKYALVDGQERMLAEVISHAWSDEYVCVFEGGDGRLHYLTASEWSAAAEEFARKASEMGLVTTESPAKDKLKLFRSLFRGREDVYAHGYAKKDGGIGYTPVCANERSVRCPRWTRANPGAKCADCPARALIPMNDRALIDHFKGERDDLRDVMGLYVLTSDCKTWVLVADFDEAGWQAEVAQYRNAARELGLSPAVERSRSGNGAHVWLFFEESTDAELARGLGSAIITHAMPKAAGMGFDSYDRLFPTQSTIAQGGFGNLIALPFQGRAQRQSNSVFVDDGFVAYLDQWRFLSSVVRVRQERAREIVEATTGGPLGQLAFGQRPANRIDQPPSSQAQTSHQLAGWQIGRDSNEALVVFPPTLDVVKAGMLHVSKKDLTQASMNRLRRLAAFGNPEFYRAQAMHQSVFGKSRIVWCGDEDESSIMLPRGCEQKLVSLAAEYGCTCIFDDRRSQGTPIRAEFVGELSERQQRAADALLSHENGILQAPTGFGKTVIGAYLIGTLKMRTLVIVPKSNLVDQWKTSLQKFLAIEDDRPLLLTRSGKPSKKVRPVIGQIGAGKSDPSGIVDIATFQSLSAKDDLGIQQAKAVVGDYDLVICDECHYGAAPNFELVMRGVRARRVYGLSATPKRSDGLEGIIYMQLGPIRHKVDSKEQAAEQGFKRILKPCFTRVRLPKLEHGSSFNQVVDELCAHAARNEMIAADVAEAVRAGRTPLVITQRKEHVAELVRCLAETNVETFMLTGEGTARERRERIERVRGAKAGRFAIVATGSYVGEGFDLPQLDTLMLASPYSWEGVITQYSGRLHRESEGKDDVVVYDYVDSSVPMLERMYKRRLKTYAKLGYDTAGGGEDRGPGARIVGARTWMEAFLADLAGTCKRAVISAPYANPKLVKGILPEITAAIARGIAVRVVMRRARRSDSAASQEAVAAELVSAGCQVDVADAPPTGIAVFDGRIAWYGTLPLLAFPEADDCSLRADAAEVASDLEDALAESVPATG